MKIPVLTICLFILTSSQLKTPAGKIKIEIDNLPSKGVLAIALYHSKEGFPYDLKKSYRCRYFSLPVSQDSLYFKDVPYGKYAVSMKYDEFYIRPDTMLMAYNHMQAFATSGKKGGNFKSASFAMNKNEKTVMIKMFRFY